ncbi:MAG: hypothetical protein QHH07_03445 [Sedimentisphaerales bacterium]|jgi:hypothetical protein|nr:hypothetical protein [Sedimentisphaerales bacterium]
MRTFAMLIGICALGLTIIPPVLFAVNWLKDPVMKQLCIDGCILWFISAPAFMKGGAK